MQRNRIVKGLLGGLLVVAMLLGVLPAVALADGASISLSSASGPAGTFVTVTGSGFAVSTTGIIWLDTNGDGVFNNGEPFPWATLTSIVTDSGGNIPAGTVLPVSANVPAGTYAVCADFPTGDGVVEASASFTVTAGIMLNSGSGIPGVTTFVTGSGFAAGTVGTVWFDTNGNAALDAGEPSVGLTTDAGGAIPLLTGLTVPSASTGDYTVQADIPEGGTIEASATFAVTSSGIIITPTYGNNRVSTGITVTGSGFAANTSFRVFLDRNRNGTRESGENYKTGTTSSSGAVSGLSAISWVSSPAGIYNMLFDLNTDGSVEASAGAVIVPSIYMSSPSGKPGTNIGMNLDGFSAYATGYVWFDTNDNGVWDAGENNASTTTANQGNATPPGLYVPDVTPGPYQVRADVPACGLTASATCYVAGLVLTPALGTSGTSIAIAGYTTGTSRSGIVWFDTDGDSAIDASEPHVAATSDANGMLSAVPLTAPDVPGGTYYVGADVPTGGFVPDVKASFTLLGPPTAAFTASTTDGAPPLTVHFTDQSTGSPTSWAWDFDNNGTVDSADQSPTFVYGLPGTYTVTLAAANAYGSDNETKTNYITVSLPAYTITASAGANGGINPSGSVVVTEGASQSFIITPNTGYHVADVLVDGVSVGVVTSYEFTNVTAVHTIEASFAIDTFTITASAGANGSIDPSGDVTVDYGASQRFTISATTGYHVVDVLVDGASVGAVTSYEFTSVTANHNISASFALDVPAWDLNGDGVCNIGDVVVIGLHWGETGDPGWIPQDLNNDGVVNIGDVVVIGLHWGESWIGD